MLHIVACVVARPKTLSWVTLLAALWRVGAPSRGLGAGARRSGAPKNPVWYNNLVKHPELDVEHRGTRLKLRA